MRSEHGESSRTFAARGLMAVGRFWRALGCVETLGFTLWEMEGGRNLERQMIVLEAVLRNRL